MKPRRNFLYLLSLLIAYVPAFSQSAEHTVDIADYALQENNADLQFLNTELQEVKVVGLGESTHGTKEFKVMNLKMFKYLVEEHGFNTLFLEDEYVPSAALDAYVKCTQDCDTLTTSILNYWCWTTEEMNELLQWIRSYNVNHPADQISIVGVDVQDSKSICEALNDILQASNLDTLSLAAAAEITKESKIDKHRLKFSSPENIAAFKAKLPGIDPTLKDRYSILLDYLQWNQIVSANPKRWHLRDLAMGRNILAVLEANPAAKGLFIAHNTHVFKFNEGKEDELKNIVLAGGVLEQALGDQYYCIMQDFDAGCFVAYHLKNQGNKKDKSNYELSTVCIEESVEKTVGSTLRDQEKVMTFITEDRLFELLGESMLKYHNIGAVFNPQKKNPKQTSDFFYGNPGITDACIFHQRSTAAVLLEREAGE